MRDDGDEKIDLGIVQREYDNAVLRSADKIFEFFSCKKIRTKKLIGINTVLVLDACDRDSIFSDAIIEKANGMLSSHSMNKIVESWELNSCTSKSSIAGVLNSDVLNGDNISRMLFSTLRTTK